MTNEELEKEVKRLEEQITELRFKILESKADKKPYKVEVPEDIETYYTINTRGELQTLVYYTKFMQEQLYKRGEAFKTREEAEQYDKERILLFKMHKWADWRNGDWYPNWKDADEPKYYTVYDYYGLTIKWDYRCRIFTKLPCFKSREIAEQFIEEFGDEIIEVLC